MATPQKTNYAAITDPQSRRRINVSNLGYRGHPYAAAALKLSALLFLYLGKLRAAEWKEIDFEKAEWRFPASKIKMKKEHIVLLSSKRI